MGARGHAGGRRPPRLADDRRAHARTRRASSRPGPRSLDYDDVALLGMGGSSLGPEVLRRSYGADEPARPRLDRPGRGARAAGEARPGADDLRRLVEVRRHDRDAQPLPLLLRARRARTARASSRSPTRAPSSRRSAERQGLRARVPQRPGDRRALQRAVATSASCRRRWRASTSRPLLDGLGDRRAPSARPTTRRRTPGCGWAARWASWRWPAATS